MRDYLLLTPLSSGQISLWHALMMVNNLCGWKSWFSAPNATVKLLSGLSERGICGAREVLKKKSLIDFVPGSVGEIAPAYHVYPVSAMVRENSRSGGKASADASANASAGASAVCSADASAGGSTYNKGNKTKLNKKKDTSNPFLKMLEDEEES